MSSQLLSDMKWTAAILRALKRVIEDRQFQEAFKELPQVGLFETALFRVSGEEDEDVAFLKIRNHYLKALGRHRADQRDLGPAHFTEDQMRILGLHPRGRQLLMRMQDGVTEAVSPAAALLDEIRVQRQRLGLD